MGDTVYIMRLMNVFTARTLQACSQPTMPGGHCISRRTDPGHPFGTSPLSSPSLASFFLPRSLFFSFPCPLRHDVAAMSAKEVWEAVWAYLPFGIFSSKEMCLVATSLVLFVWTKMRIWSLWTKMPVSSDYDRGPIDTVVGVTYMHMVQVWARHEFGAVPP